jgi:hypothetical protein
MATSVVPSRLAARGAGALVRNVPRFRRICIRFVLKAWPNF